MNVLHLNTHTNSFNLSFPHVQFHEELIEAGENSFIISATGNAVFKNIKILKRGFVFSFFGISRLLRKIVFDVLVRNTSYYFYPEWNTDLITTNQVIRNLPFKPDVILTYWTKFAFNQKLVYELSDYYTAPVICIMMDMAPFTGGCHYAFRCKNYFNNCGKCPAIKSKTQNDVSYKTWLFKKKYIEKTNLTIIACTSTLLNQANNSSLFKNLKKEKLLLSVNERIFIPGNKLSARESFNIPKEKKIIFFGASSIQEERKGMSYFIKSLQYLSLISNKSYKNEDVFLLIAGNNIGEIQFPFEYKHVGYLSSQEELAKAYQACDLFACPSIEDSGPLMINQAIMSGRPVVAFEMGVAPDLVKCGETGYLAKLYNIKDFSKGLNNILELDNNNWQLMSNTCRKLGISEFASGNHFDKLMNILKNVVDNKF
jgi:glycosyltransferase involved in cell wall biosynthesis